MKRIISIIVTLFLFMNLLTTFVFADNNINITSVTYDSDNGVFSLIVNGICAPGSNVSLLVKNKNSVIKAMEQFKIKTNGNNAFSYNVDVDVSSDTLGKEADGSYIYTVYVRDNKNNSAQYSVTLFSEDSKRIIIQDFLNTASSTETMMKYIEKYESVFGFNKTHYVNAKSSVADYFIAVKNETPLTLDNVVDKYNEAIIRAYLFVDDKNADRIEYIEYHDYSEMIGFNDDDSLYSVYKNMASKNKVNEIVFAKEHSMKSFDDLKEIFFMAITSVVFDENKDDLTNVSDMLEKYNSWYGLEGFSELTTYEKSLIIGELSKKDIPDNKLEFANLYNAEFAVVKEDDVVILPPATGGGGGAAGGNVGSIADNVGYEPTEDSVELTPVEKVSFNDIVDYEWAKDAIETLAKKGVVNGRNNNTFAPADYITREEFSKILAIAFGLYDENADADFTDVDENRWSYKYVASMYENGIITGYPDGSFNPQSYVTREEMAVMLYRTLVRVEKVDTEYESYSSYKDYNDISSFALNSVITLSNHNILSGDDTGKFNPKKGATRAEVCKMIYNTGI